MPAAPYKVVSYAIDNLISLLSEESLASCDQIKDKLHRLYFEDYFNGINAKTIVVEYDYIDHDYLEDFSSYYVKCFNTYNRKCTRLHFFNVPFSQRSFTLMLSGNSVDFSKKLPKSYLGFIVVKKLPKTIIGRTCLKTYSEKTSRHFPTKRTYEVNLFGLNLNVETLAYQEQDKVAAACATSSLWSIFNGTGMIFHHTIPTPVEITKAATVNSPTQSRNLPNDGLTLEQMAHAIRNVGLEPFAVTVQNEYVLKSTIFSYLKAGIPIAMAIAIYDTSVQPHAFKGRHAVAVTGYNIVGTDIVPLKGTGFLSKSSRINKIYVHDDQVGPFARMKLDNMPVTIDKENLFSLSSSWIGQDGNLGSVRAIPYTVLLPLYHKIRIPLEIIENLLIDFDVLIEFFRTNNLIPALKKRLEWEVFLSSLNDLKTGFFQSRLLKADQQKGILTEKLPKFIWRAIASVDDEPVIELVFDATDIEQGNFFLRSIKYNNDFFEVLKLLISQPAIENIIATRPSRTIFDRMREQN